MDYKQNGLNFLRGMEVAALLLVLGACSGTSSDNSGGAQNGAASNLLVTSASYKVFMPDGINPIDSTLGINIISGAPYYKILMKVAGVAAGTPITLKATNTSLPAEAVSTIPITVGVMSDLAISSGPGNYHLEIQVPGYTVSNKTVAIQAACTSDPGFTLSSLSGATVTAQKVKDNNFNILASGFPAASQCAWDPTGTGIVDTVFDDCSKGLTSFYTNFVNDAGKYRNAGVLVQDACFTTLEIHPQVNFPFTMPAMGAGNVFIYGSVSALAPTDPAAGDTRIDGVQYFASNKSNPAIVYPSYGGGSFKISSYQQYKVNDNSQPFGMDIELKGITDNIDVSAGTGSVDVSKASIAILKYSTDLRGDQLGQVSMKWDSQANPPSPGNCVLSNQNSKVTVVPMGHCVPSDNTSTAKNSVTVEIWGNYTCEVSDGVHHALINNGKFDGYYKLPDACGGGGGGGGSPINGV